MQSITNLHRLMFARSLRVIHTRLNRPARFVRHAGDKASPPELPKDGPHQEEKEKSAMSRRLAAMSEESLETGGRSAIKAVEEAGFSDELKARLSEKIANASFRSDNASAFAQADMPASAGRGTRDIAAARPWAGTETIEDASLRMLNDAHKPLRIRGTPKVPGLGGPPPKVDTGRPGKKGATGARLANARDKSSIYSYLKDDNTPESEKERFRRELKERFQPGSRAVPATIQGLASLANERIEDAIARGQFKNLPRGKNIERDYNASNPFLDTTEYFMNKIIQKQEIVPPWIEKQQELGSTAHKFRSRLRADWRRHVARSIASRGGSLESQLQLAEEYAYAESLENPSKKKVNITTGDNDQSLISQLTLAGELKAAAEIEGPQTGPETKLVEVLGLDSMDLGQPKDHDHPENEAAPLDPTLTAPRKPIVAPFRDSLWEETERSYHNVAIENLNSITRSYNLMAPDLAKKPYFSLSRELKSCFADVAPDVAALIRERALAPKVKGYEAQGKKAGGMLEKFSMGDDDVKVYLDRRPNYGFKQFLKDLFSTRS